MATTADDLMEPHVLAHAKRRLFPENDREDAYAVVDTQFAQERWIDRTAIDEAVRETLAPFNHVRVGSGYPDLVGVRPVDDDLLAVDRLGGEPPLIAVEAKGYTDGGGVDVERGVVQAHDRLDEANVAFLAAPEPAISQSARSLARECNVGVLAVGTDGRVASVETPRVVGNRTTDAATSIRFQASAQGVAGKSFGLNHPKNYLAYPLAVAHDRETAAVLAERVVRAVDSARTGAGAFPTSRRSGDCSRAESSTLTPRRSCSSRSFRRSTTTASPRRRSDSSSPTCIGSTRRSPSSCSSGVTRPSAGEC